MSASKRKEVYLYESHVSYLQRTPYPDTDIHAIFILAALQPGGQYGFDMDVKCCVIVWRSKLHCRRLVGRCASNRPLTDLGLAHMEITCTLADDLFVNH
jgi:hypothetical protein